MTTGDDVTFGMPLFGVTADGIFRFRPHAAKAVNAVAPPELLLGAGGSRPRLFLEHDDNADHRPASTRGRDG